MSEGFRSNLFWCHKNSSENHSKGIKESEMRHSSGNIYNNKDIEHLLSSSQNQSSELSSRCRDLSHFNRDWAYSASCCYPSESNQLLWISLSHRWVLLSNMSKSHFRARKFSRYRLALFYSNYSCIFDPKKHQ